MKSKNSLKDITCLGILILTLFLSLNVILYGFTGKNYISIVEKKLLRAMGVYTEEIKYIEIESDGWSSNAEGSWHINKSAKWTKTTTSEVDFYVSSVIKSNGRNKDIIFVLDISGSMAGDKLDKVKSDSEDLINYVLSDSDNRVALITFESTSQFVTDFTNDNDYLVQYINDSGVKGDTNYNAALLDVETIMENYVYDENEI